MLNRTRALLLVTVTAVVVSACSSGTSSAPATKPTGGGTTVTAAGKGVAGTTTVGAGPSQLTGELTSSLSGFSPETSGFSFADYATDAGTTNLTATEVQRFFGVRVCANGTPDGCILTPPAERWMAIANALMADGHGEGMAVLALLLHEHAADAAVLGDGATETSEAKLAGNEGLQREIAYWNATQVLAPTATTRGADLSPSDVVAKLRQSFGPGGDETYTLGVRQVVDGSPRAGRTLAPYGIVDKGDGTVEVAVYDSSFPGQARAVKVDTTTQVWSYDGGGDAPDPRARYEGDGSAPNLLLTPISARRQPQTCPFCAPPSTPAPRLRGAVPGQPLLPPEINSALIFSGPGSAPMLAAAAAWDGLAADLASSAASFASVTSGLAGTAWQGPAASAMAAAATPYTQWLQTASGQGESSAAQAQTVAAAFSMDPTQSYAVTIPASPSPVSAPSLEQPAAKTTSVAFVSAGVTYHVDGIPLDADKPRLVLFRPADGLVAYYSEGSSSLSIGAGFEADGADYAFSASDVDMPTGGFVVAKLDRGAGTFTVRNLAAATDTYALTMRRIDDAGQLEFRNDGIDLSSGAAIDVDYQPWDADGKALAARTRSAAGATAVELPDE